MTRSLVVVAVGGNALLHRGETPTIVGQRTNVRRASAALATLAASHRLVVTHGNGPQVGLLARQAEALVGPEPVPLDVLDAESAGLIGYLLATELGRHLGDERVAAMLTRVVVDRDDPAFAQPTKPIGVGRRRLVASPDPRRIVELGAVRTLVDADVTVVCCGGGGVPVVESGAGGLEGVEAVVDKDLTSALLAQGLAADELVMLTDVDAVFEAWGSPKQTPIRSATPAQLRARSWETGSMGPKIEAACRFVDATGGTARIGALDHATEVLAGRAGTVVLAR